ncbi:MAG: NAD-dependent dehydratase [Verrucomicrobia bacterium]|nr:NAD-dependent dehydratase [Verrucomicrobiota bacterium]
MKTLLLVGATGLVGQSVLRQALDNPDVAQLVAPTRRPLPPHAKLENPLVDFDALPEGAPWWRVDGVICTLGTTIKRAGSQPAFRKVDHDYPLAVAALARRSGAGAYALTSSVGADPSSRTFYLRTKGETERALAALGFPSLTIVRPSFIGGDRAERRPLEALGLRLFAALTPLLPRRYRVVSADHIARALLEAVLAARPGTHFIESEAIAPTP